MSKLIFIFQFFVFCIILIVTPLFFNVSILESLTAFYYFILLSFLIVLIISIFAICIDLFGKEEFKNDKIKI